MADKLSVEIDATEYGPDGENAVLEFTVQPTGVGSIGTAEIALTDPAGGFNIVPMQPVTTGRKNGAGNFSPRLLYGILANLEQSQQLGTATKDWRLQLQDVNMIGVSIGTPYSFTYPAASAHLYGYHINKYVDAVQAAYGAGYTSIDSTSQVVLDIGIGAFTMPALEGGHELNWYIEQVNNRVIELSSAAIIPAYFYGMDTTAGATFGPVTLYAYDSVLFPTPGTYYSTTPTGAEKAIRAWKIQDDATTLYVRRQATYTGGTATGYDATADAAYPCPWSAGGWWRTPDKYDTTSSAEAQALIDADVASNSNPLRTITLITDRAIHQPGDVIGVTIDLTPLSAEPYRVVRSRIIFEDKIADYALCEITAGLLPRGLGRTGGGAIVPSYIDRVPPERPAAAPTLLLNLYQPAGEGARAAVQLKCINSISHDVAWHRLRLVINSSQIQYSPWIAATGPSPAETTFPVIEVPAGALISASVQARDSSNNDSVLYSNSTVFTSARAPGGPPPGWDGWDAYDVDAGGVNFPGWARSATSGTSSASRNTTTVYFGKTSLQLSVGSTVGDMIEYEGSQVSAQAGKLWEVMVARRATVATGTAALLIRCYNSSDTLISTITVWSGTPTTAWVEVPNASRVITLPALCAYFVPVLRYTSTGTTSALLWAYDRARWKILSSVESLDLRPDGSVPINKKDSSTGDIREREYYTSGYYTRQGVATGGTEVGEKLLNSRGQGLLIPPDTNVTGQVNLFSEGGLSVTGVTSGLTLDGINGFAATGRLQIIPGVKTATFTPDVLNSLYYFTNSPTINLPTAVGISGAMYAFVNTGTGTGTVDGSSTQTINGVLTWSIFRKSTLIIVSDGANWQVVNPPGNGLISYVPPDSSAFSWRNQGTSTLTDYGQAQHLLPQAGAGLESLRIRYKAVPSAPYTITAALMPRLQPGNYTNCGLTWDDGTKVITLRLVWVSGSFALYLDKWNSVTGYNSNYSSMAPVNLNAGMHWLRISDDNTNRHAWYSSDGINFDELGSGVSRTDFLTATNVGWFCDPFTSGLDAAVTLLSWEQT